jgi:hypothetical protein
MNAHSQIGFSRRPTDRPVAADERAVPANKAVEPESRSRI